VNQYIRSDLHSVIEVVHLSSLQRYNIFSVLVEGVGFVPIITYRYSRLSAYAQSSPLLIFWGRVIKCARILTVINIRTCILVTLDISPLGTINVLPNLTLGLIIINLRLYNI
jgi:hypothetical protein